MWSVFGNHSLIILISLSYPLVISAMIEEESDPLEDAGLEDDPFFDMNDDDDDEGEEDTSKTNNNSNSSNTNNTKKTENSTKSTKSNKNNQNILPPHNNNSQSIATPTKNTNLKQSKRIKFDEDEEGE